MSQDFIRIVGARENNLRNVSLDILKHKITIFTGVSGSGKSSIVFDTIAQEAGRQLNETFTSFTRLFMPRYSQPAADSIEGLATAVTIDQKRLGGTARSTLGTITDINPLFRVLFSRYSTPSIGYANAFSFNDPLGMCPQCEGIGKVLTLDLEAALDQGKSLNEGAILLPGYKPGSWFWKFVVNNGGFNPDKKISDYSEEEYQRLVYAEAEKVKVNVGDGEMNTTYEGLVPTFVRKNIKTEYEKSEATVKKMEQFTKSELCPMCQGKRFSPRTLEATIDGYNIYDLTSMQLTDLLAVLDGLDGDLADNPLAKSIALRVQNLIDIGLDYVTLDRETATLSGGESQRVKMVKHLSSSLTGLCYIFDEPSIGLHARDVHRLNELLIKLRDKGNTVLVVEHDPDVMKIADYIVDMGPHAGSHGGQIVFEGSFEDLQKADTLTARFLNQGGNIKIDPRPAKDFIKSTASSLHNLKDTSLSVPQGLLTVVTGVAGSGKSTLVSDVFALQHPDAVCIDQRALAANARSNSATFTGIMDRIRKLFADENDVSAALFSYNSEGACSMCKGTGSIEINLSFMDTISQTCPECNGKRYKKEVLDYYYKGSKEGKGVNIVDVMDMTVADALDFFEDKSIKSKLKGIHDVGLAYMTLGQPLSTLSGGECQRLKLAKELRKKGGTYILDEPTTGLHMSDTQVIIDNLNQLVDHGNTVIVIEHNFDIIRNADWIVDMGPDGGVRGGQVLYSGPPAGLKNCKESITAKYL
ncbi:MAG: excinuclease ABC subunit UvrA [Coriobacteriia bacterium]|nr:excinuclease ABC subunit UvrA [Coriobacteriia bacterium]